VGARCPDYESNYLQIAQDLHDFTESQTSRTKLRIYIELQYSESLQFFS